METPEAGQNIITRGLPKTSQTVLYQAGDDGDYEAGWWKGRLNANNRTRFIAKTIGGDDIVLDRATGLMWAADGNAAGCNNGAVITWANAIIYAEALTFATFSDWRVPNIKELGSIVDYSRLNPSVNVVFFSNTQNFRYCSSTTYIGLVTAIWYVMFSNGNMYPDPKTDEYYLRCVRKGL